MVISLLTSVNCSEQMSERKKELLIKIAYYRAIPGRGQGGLKLQKTNFLPNGDLENIYIYGPF